MVADALAKESGSRIKKLTSHHQAQRKRRIVFSLVDKWLEAVSANMVCCCFQTAQRPLFADVSTLVCSMEGVSHLCRLAVALTLSS
jgi:hypothetical protein